MVRDIKLNKGLYAITPQQNDTDVLLQQVEQALLGGIALLQYRDKSSSPDIKRSRANALRKLCTKYQAPLIINDDAELALTCHADGVHLGQSDGSIQQARQLLGAQAIIGVTCHHHLKFAAQAEKEGADYVAFGRFFASNTKPGEALATTDLLLGAKRQTTLPIVAIGGITLSNAPPLINAGADYLAVIENIFVQKSIRSYCQQFSSLFQQT
ncbi:MAG: thiamine phosphate synthase [Cycloclasticus sp.]|nr:MAG: thiamine phosphate synthase [Cycloclasticus sp.]